MSISTWQSWKPRNIEEKIARWQTEKERLQRFEEQITCFACFAVGVVIGVFGALIAFEVWR